jgi:hypothetical protein
MPALGLRTIWITLRAINYTDYAFQKTIINLNNLMSAEEAASKATIQHARYAAMAGMMWMALGVQLGQAGIEMARTTTALKPFVNAVDSLFKTMGQSESLKVFLSILLLTVSALMLFGGAAMMVKAIQDIAWLPSVHKMIVAHQTLATAIGACFGAFMVFMIIGQVIGKQAGAIVAAIVSITAALLALAVAMNIVSVGTLTPFQLAAVAAGAAMAAGVMAIGKSFQLGTRSVGATGLAFVHKHEVIYNPSTNQPTQIGNDLNGGAGETNFYDIPVTIENVNTKADFDDLDEKLRKSLGKLARNRR